MPTATLAAAGARGHAPPRPANRSIIVGEFQLNNFEAFRAEVLERNGKRVISIARWKSTPNGERRCGQSLEFAEHRAVGVAELVNAVLRAIAE
jgi:hypothetical protein